ncbi:MAG: cytochrome c-type biogenesis protein CcmH [Pseudolabrys sp.]|nr:cytochrome c-type biogenesis protein CcmH [Pseudolabrys sp.]MBV9261632.1 cytochrome c-type biogenesis protein CcmH [Pseudolabrys sp.]
MRAVLFAALVALNIVPALAVQPDEMLKDPVLEERARHLSRELRCMVCQNQSIDDSDAPLARDLRLLVRERLTAGDSDTKVVDFLVSRYGEFVLLKPRFEWRTVLLWGFPPAVVLVGVLLLWITARRRAVEDSPALTSAERNRLATLVEGQNRDGSA